MFEQVSHRVLDKLCNHKNKKLLHIYMRLLISSSYKDEEVNGVLLKRGQLIMNQVQFSKAMNMSRSTFQDNLKALEKEKEISISKNVITITNYEVVDSTDSSRHLFRQKTPEIRHPNPAPQNSDFQAQINSEMEDNPAPQSGTKPQKSGTKSGTHLNYYSTVSIDTISKYNNNKTLIAHARNNPSENFCQEKKFRFKPQELTRPEKDDLNRQINLGLSKLHKMFPKRPTHVNDFKQAVISRIDFTSKAVFDLFEKSFMNRYRRDVTNIELEFQKKNIIFVHKDVEALLHQFWPNFDKYLEDPFSYLNSAEIDIYHELAITDDVTIN